MQPGLWLRVCCPAVRLSCGGSDILDYSKIEAGEMRLRLAAHNPADVVEAALLTCYANARAKGLALTWYVEPTSIPPALLLDETRLQQIVINLLSNAIKFTRHGGIQLRVTGRALEDSSAAAGGSATSVAARSLQSTTPDAPARSLRRVELRFELSDTGIGISPEQLKSLFSSFSQVHHSSGEYGGTGLGSVTHRPPHCGRVQALR
jgi:two-component system sensor histidine kinase/response regulator